MSFLDSFTFSPRQCPREISQNVSGLYNVKRGAGYKIHICAKLYCFGRAKVLSSVATDFGPSTIKFYIRSQLLLKLLTRFIVSSNINQNMKSCKFVSHKNVSAN